MNPSDLSPVDPHARELVIEVAIALHATGASAHHLEDTIEELREALGLPFAVLATPTALFVSGDKPEVIPVRPGPTHLDRRVAIDRVAAAVASRSLSPKDGVIALRDLVQRPPAWPGWVRVFAQGLSAASAAALMGGAWVEVGLAAAIGLGAGLLASKLEARRSAARVELPLAALFASLAAGLVTEAFAVSVPRLTVAALIGFMPGLSMTVGLSELATGHWTSGAGRLSGVAATLLLLALGATVGWGLAEGIVGPWRELKGASAGVPSLAGAMVAAPVAFAILLQARPRHIPLIALACWTAYGAARGGEALGGPVVGAGMGALAVGLLGNLVNRRLMLPAVVCTAPGLLVLVPGSVGFRGVQALVDQHTVEGVHTAFTAVFVAAALAAGLLLSHALLSPRRISRPSHGGFPMTTLF